MKIRKGGCLLLLLLLCLPLTGCRIRTTGAGSVQRKPETEEASPLSPASPDSAPASESDEAKPEEEQAAAEAAGERTKENPDAARKEYDENAPAEIVPGTERTVHAEGEGGGAFAPGAADSETVSKLNDAAEDTATRTVPAEEAEQTGVADGAEEADSAMTYFTVLLAERTGSLFECQRKNVYWETAGDHVTVFKASPEHALILRAGAYDVSARLLEENLRVDDGWISRKNPGVIVKTVDRGVLGAGVSSTAEAQRVYAGLINREGWASIDAVRSGRVILLSEELLEAPSLQVAAMLAIAKTANPDLFRETDLDSALEMLAEEAAGGIPAGIYYYTGPGSAR